MKKLLFALLAVAVSPPLFAQVSGTITSSQLVCIGVSADHSTVGVQVTGTWTGTLQPQVAIQGQALTNSQVVPSTSNTAASTITANGVYYANVGSASQFCILGNTVSSGSAVVFLNAAKGVNASTLGGGGGGSGTVTNTGGNLTANAVVLGAGTVDTKVSTGLTTDGVAAITQTQGTITTSNPFDSHTATWNAAGVAFTDWLSNITCTAAAAASIAAGFGTAGTQWQFKYGGANCATPQMLSPDGTSANPAYSFSASAAYGIFRDGTNNGLGFSANGTNNFVMTAGFLKSNSSAVIGWTNGNAGGGGMDSGFSRTGANVVALGNGAAADESALLRAGNTCRITADVSLTVNTANSFCSFSLPAVAKAWAFRCDIQWAITAGSGTNTFALGVNPSQSPTGTTNAEAQVYTAGPATTATMASAAISASGATNILTGATYTPGATVQLAKISGTLLASGTAGTFAITAAANGTTATAAVKAGSACWLN